MMVTLPVLEARLAVLRAVATDLELAIDKDEGLVINLDCWDMAGDAAQVERQILDSRYQLELVRAEIAQIEGWLSQPVEPAPSVGGDAAPSPEHGDDRGATGRRGRVRPSRDDILSVSAAAAALPWRRATAFRWLRAEGLVVSGPDGRECVRWSDVLDALGQEPEDAPPPPPKRPGRPRRRPATADPWARLPAADLSGP
jgi:hypothetical protein